MVLYIYNSNDFNFARLNEDRLSAYLTKRHCSQSDTNKLYFCKECGPQSNIGFTQTPNLSVI